MKKKYKKDFRRPGSIIAKKIARFLLVGSFLSFLLGSMLTGFPILAFIWNITVPSTSAKLSEILSNPINASEIDLSFTEKNNEYELPKKDVSLPETQNIIIEKIGVNTQIIEQPLDKYEDALQQGVWRVPDFSTPLDREMPIILAAHRFGYINWSQDFREQNSFFNLPNLEVGDQVEIVWDQRRFVYEIYQKEESKNISHYNADLILYTCKFLESDIRIFQYARLIESQ